MKFARTYIGEAVYVDGSLDYLMHEEGRVAYELGNYQYEYHVKDHLGNPPRRTSVRQVLRNPTTQVFMATMETENATEEEATFSQLSESRQSGAEHNVTEGGDQVAWLNADRGRIAGPGRTQPIYAGDSVTLRVHGKYAEPTLTKLNAGTYLTQSAKDQMVDGISELAGSLKRSGSGNPIALLNLANILAGDLQRKEAPEAYLIYALYDADSNRYEVGKQVLTKNAANQHEVLEENLYISEDGYLETFVINETSEDVWFDDFMVMITTSPVMQETHYDPWGLELTGIGFQYGDIKANKYLYNGNEILSDLDLNLYDFKSRFYDPAIGRFISIDVLADHPNQIGLSPYQFSWNNPIRYNDPDGKCPSCWPMLYAAYQGMKAKYSGILSQANAPAQRLISGASGNTPSNIGMNQEMRTSIKIAGISSDLNAVTDVGKTLGRETTMDLGNTLDTGGGLISDAGVALAIPTKGMSLALVPFGEVTSAAGKVMKGLVYYSEGDNRNAAIEGGNIVFGVATNSLTKAAVRESKRVGNITNSQEETITETVLGGLGSLYNKVVNYFTHGDEKDK